MGSWVAVHAETRKEALIEKYGDQFVDIHADGSCETQWVGDINSRIWQETSDGILILDFLNSPLVYNEKGYLEMVVYGVKFVFFRKGGAPQIPGDVQNDGEIDLSDAIAILDYCAGGASINATNADVNADGAVDLRDVLLILQYLAGWNVTLK